MGIRRELNWIPQDDKRIATLRRCVDCHGIHSRQLVPLDDLDLESQCSRNLPTPPGFGNLFNRGKPAFGDTLSRGGFSRPSPVPASTILVYRR